MSLTPSRRLFLLSAGAAAAVLPLGRGLAWAGMKDAFTPGTPPPFITAEERLKRIAQAQVYMDEAGLDAVLLEPGASMEYFTGLKWWRSERPTVAVLARRGPAEGAVSVITPFFEEPSVRETITVPAQVRTWQEDDDPMALLAELIRDMTGKQGAKLGIEGSVRHFIVHGVAQAGHFDIAVAESVVQRSRMIKSASELALMRHANHIVLAAYSEVIPSVVPGDTPASIGARMRAAITRLGGNNPWTLVLIGVASAYPHGTGQTQRVRERDVVLMDCGCAFGGYQADISRTFAVGQPSAALRRMWSTVRAGQEVVMETAQVGVLAGKVDDAVRRFYEKQGYGPDYALPGLPHRTGHGIGMEGHEPINFVRGERTPLAPRMCFSNEPGLYDPAHFGVRLEDCLTITENGPVWFTEPPQTLDSPVGRLVFSEL